MKPAKFVKFRPKPLLSDTNHAYVENLGNAVGAKIYNFYTSIVDRGTNYWCL